MSQDTDALREAAISGAASLAAAISLLERGSKKVAPSDKMFDMMLSDYKRSLEGLRHALSRQPEGAGERGAGPNEARARQDWLSDSQYAAGMKAGWNFAIAGEDEAFDRAVASRVGGHRATIEEGRGLDAAIRQPEGAGERDEWQPIETAPEGTFCLVHQGGAIRTMLKENGAWKSLAVAVDRFGDHAPGVTVRETGVYQPTHWMPLPAPPALRTTTAPDDGGE